MSGEGSGGRTVWAASAAGGGVEAAPGGLLMGRGMGRAPGPSAFRDLALLGWRGVLVAPCLGVLGGGLLWAGSTLKTWVLSSKAKNGSTQAMTKGIPPIKKQMQNKREKENK
jgi:hypothetical protein